MSIKTYFKPVETIAVMYALASSIVLSIGKDVEITKQVNKASKQVNNKRKK